MDISQSMLEKIGPAMLRGSVDVWPSSFSWLGEHVRWVSVNMMGNPNWLHKIRRKKF